MTLTLINMTPHVVRVFDTDDTTLLLEIQPSGAFARVQELRRPAEPLSSVTHATAPIPVTDVANGQAILDLPDPVSGTAYIVARLTAFAAPHRRDLYFPFDEVRDQAGQTVGCHRLGRVAP